MIGKHSWRRVAAASIGGCCWPDAGAPERVHLEEGAFSCSCRRANRADPDANTEREPSMCTHLPLSRACGYWLLQRYPGGRDRVRSLAAILDGACSGQLDSQRPC